MRLARVFHQEQIWIGTVDKAGRKIDLITQQIGNRDVVIELIETFLLENATLPKSETSVGIDEVQILAPIHRPSKNILCVGKNYAAHATEFANSGFDATAAGKDSAIPEAPIIFSKAPCCLTGAYADVHAPWQLTSMVDYEAELGVVIGRGGRSINHADAYDHVFGYTVINDVTARDLQSKHKQWLLGKSIDTFCPMGPWIVSADEINPEGLTVSCWVNGERRQHANTKDLIFDIPTIIATISNSMSLLPGDIIATGTPAGVGIGFDPPKFLRSGDVVKVDISNVGTLQNKIT